MRKFGGTWQHIPRCVSTNDEALKLGRQGAPEGIVVTADVQTQGRGRQGRSWYSPPGENLYLSLLLRPELPPMRAPFLTLCAGVALAEAALHTLRRETGMNAEPATVKLKWPNDLLLASSGQSLRKAGGILTEMVCSGGRIDFVVIGIGCNVNSLRFPDELTATSLRQVLGLGQPPLLLPSFASELLSQLQLWYERFLTAGTDAVLRAFEGHAAYLGEATPITVRSGEQQLTGCALGLDTDGALLVQDAAQQVHRVLAGEIVQHAAQPSE
jgi:BirA family biotin operon repressor/biotin-[acetyl-CoA-carboxylase] ligase